MMFYVSLILQPIINGYNYFFLFLLQKYTYVKYHKEANLSIS